MEGGEGGGPRSHRPSNIDTAGSQLPDQCILLPRGLALSKHAVTRHHSVHGYVVTVIVTISLALGNTLAAGGAADASLRSLFPLPSLSHHTLPLLVPSHLVTLRSPHTRTHSAHPSPPLPRNVRNENECISDSGKYRSRFGRVALSDPRPPSPNFPSRPTRDSVS